MASSYETNHYKHGRFLFHESSADKSSVLIQFNDHVDGEQVRLSLEPMEAIRLAKELLGIAHDLICQE